MNEPILYDTHMHTPLCKHARGEPEAYAAAAEKRGLKGIIITCHNPGPDGWSPKIRMRLEQFDDYIQMVERARQAWVGRIDVRLGLESDFVPGMEPFLEQLHARANLNYILGSVHPQLAYYREAYDTGNALKYQQTYFEHLAQAAESGLFDTLAHPDLVKNVYPNAWNPTYLLDDIKRSLDRIAKTGIAMELNTSGLHKRVRQMNPTPLMLTEMKARNIPIVVGSDAHNPNRVAADFEQAFDLLEDIGFTHVSFFLERQRHDVNLIDASESLQSTKKLAFI